MRPLVLIGFAQSLAFPEAVFSLHQAGFRVCAFRRPGGMSLSWKGLPLEEVIEITTPEVSTEQAVVDLRQAIASRTDIAVLMGVDDVSLWLVNEAASQLTRNGREIRVANARGEACAVALDKARQVDLAKAAGLSVLPTVLVRQVADLAAVTHFPSIARPARAITLTASGALGKGETLFFHAAEDLAKVKVVDPEEPLLVQPLVHGVGVGVFGFAGAGGVHCLFGHRRLRMMNPHGSGASACEVARPSEDLCNAVRAFIDGVGWVGPFMVELLRDDEGRHWFVELNGRLWGSLALSRRNGFEYAAWAVEQALDPAFVPRLQANLPQRRQVRHLGREILHLLFLIKGPKTRFHAARWPRLMTSLRGVLTPCGPKGFYNFDAAFPGFFLREAYGTVMRTLRKGRS